MWCAFGCPVLLVIRLFVSIGGLTLSIGLLVTLLLCLVPRPGQTSSWHVLDDLRSCLWRRESPNGLLARAGVRDYSGRWRGFALQVHPRLALLVHVGATDTPDDDAE